MSQISTTQSMQLAPQWRLNTAMPAAIAQSSLLALGPSGQAVAHPGDAFERAVNQPVLSVNPKGSWKFALRHPLQSMKLHSNLPAIAGESAQQRVFMYQRLYMAMDHQGRANFNSLLKRGVLNDNRTDDGHSTLYQLYSMLTTQRAPGLNGANLVREMVRILNKPYYITQKYDKLSESAAQQILDARNNFSTYLNRSGEMPPKQPVSWNDINDISSAECVPSSVMYCMADKFPGELARECKELTSPIQGFYRKLNLRDLSPDDPQAAYRILENHQIHYAPINPESAWVKVELPSTALIRAIDSNHHAPINNVRTSIETTYQSALMFLADRSYDAATDTVDSDNPKGLTEMQKTLIESVIKGNGGVASVTYQVVAGKENPAPGEENQPFLYGYTRTFEQTAADIIQALQMDQFVIIGIIDTESNGMVPGGHEITITSAFVDPKDGKLKFYVIDSDDDILKPVVRSAEELIPKIHHAGMPWSLAKQIKTEIESVPGYYFVTDANDERRYETLAHVQERVPAEAKGPAIIAPITEELFNTGPTPPEIAYTQPTQQINPAAIQTITWDPIQLYQPAQQTQQPSPINIPPVESLQPALQAANPAQMKVTSSLGVLPHLNTIEQSKRWPPLPVLPELMPLSENRA